MSVCVCVLCVVSVQDFERLLQDVNRTTMKAIQVYVDQVSWGAIAPRRHSGAMSSCAWRDRGLWLHPSACTDVAAWC